MLDQMFTSENFRQIFDTENRKGRDLAGWFFPDLEPYTQAIRDKVKEIRSIRSNESSYSPEVFSSKIADLKAELYELKSQKFAAIDNKMELVSANVREPNFKISLSKKVGPKHIPVFCIDGTPETFFVVKQLQQNIGKIYGVKQSSRHDLVSRFHNTVLSRFPFEIVRTDITKFYESIDRKKLLRKLESDQLLSPFSKKYIKQILDEYGKHSNALKGIPRGVGISAYLAELYLRPIDKEIKNIPGIVLYCRFVDDILAVFARPPTGGPQGSFQSRIVKTLTDHGLTNNVNKTAEIDLSVPGVKEIEYLGYRFVLDSGKCAIYLSASKISKYETRINEAFEDYAAHSSLAARRAYRDLVSRVKFLTGNTRLSNSKSSAVTGIYYNNSMLTELSSFQTLDQLLKSKVDAIQRPALRDRLKKFKFAEGFGQRRFHNFSARELASIVKAWSRG